MDFCLIIRMLLKFGAFATTFRAVDFDQNVMFFAYYVKRAQRRVLKQVGEANYTTVSVAEPGVKQAVEQCLVPVLVLCCKHKHEGKKLFH